MRDTWTRRDFLRSGGVAAAAFSLADLWLDEAFAAEAAAASGAAAGVAPVFADHFGLDAAAMEKLLAIAMSRGGDYADLYCEYKLSNSISFEENQVKDAARGIVLGAGVRVVAGDKTGYAYSDDLSFERLKRAAETAAHIAMQQRQVGPIAIAAQSLPQYYLGREMAGDAAVKQKLALIERASQAGYAADRRITRMFVNYGDEIRIVQIANTAGQLVRDTQPMVRFRVRALAEEGSERQNGSMAGGGRVGLEHFATTTPESLGEKAARQAITMLHADEAPAGMMEVVLGNAYSGILLHEAVGHGLEADFNRKGTSNYSNRVGEMVASELCTVVDDGTIAGDRGAINVDDEGNASQRKVLIERGRLVGYMHDRISARAMSAPATGSGRRESYRHVPLPRMTTTYMLAGESTPEEIIRSVKRGFYAVSFGGGQVDITNGDFVFAVTEGYLIEDGKVTRPVKGATLIGNGPEVLGQVNMVGNDFRISEAMWTCGKDGQSVPVGVGMPHAKIAAITVGGTRKPSGLPTHLQS
jgi:TldD protein